MQRRLSFRVFSRLLLVPALVIASVPVSARIPHIAPENIENQRILPVAFIGVDVITMADATLLENQTVIVRDGKIRLIGPAASVRVPSDVHHVQAKGKVLMPALTDMHVHIHNEDDLPLYLANGITRLRVMGGTRAILRMRDRIRAGELLGPELRVAGPMIDGERPVWAQAERLTDPKDADALVRAQREAGYEFVKVYVGLSSHAYVAVVRAARKYGLPVVGHVPYDVPLDRVLRSGQLSIEHLDGYVEAIQREGSPFAGKSDTDTRLFAIDHIDDEKLAAIAEQTARANVWTCPTFVVEQNWMTADEASPKLEHPRMRHMMDATLRWWRKHGGTNLSKSQHDYVRKLYDVRKRLVLAIHRAGGKILAGSDSPNPLLVHGFALHEELGYLRDAGLSNFDVLEAATVNADAFFDGRARAGTLYVGSAVDLLLVDGNPLEDLDALREPQGLLIGGRWYPRYKLRLMLEEVAYARSR